MQVRYIPKEFLTLKHYKIIDYYLSLVLDLLEIVDHDVEGISVVGVK